MSRAATGKKLHLRVPRRPRRGQFAPDDDLVVSQQMQRRIHCDEAPERVSDDL